ncbi:hypothetical protein XMV209_002131 [Aliiroseovarius sp. xm-v-209]|nr:hypothetical protein [Aliiroseovarius sp. xm-m-314]NRP80521.1 hypothetical protein [Aliiroseovarius sp. xm-v-209]
MCEPTERPTMHFVSAKNEETKGAPMIFLIREPLNRQRTRDINVLHRHLGKFG